MSDHHLLNILPTAIRHFYSQGMRRSKMLPVLGRSPFGIPHPLLQAIDLAHAYLPPGPSLQTRCLQKFAIDLATDENALLTDVFNVTFHTTRTSSASWLVCGPVSAIFAKGYSVQCVFTRRMPCPRHAYFFHRFNACFNTSQTAPELPERAKFGICCHKFHVSQKNAIFLGTSHLLP